MAELTTAAKILRATGQGISSAVKKTAAIAAAPNLDALAIGYATSKISKAFDYSGKSNRNNIGSEGRITSPGGPEKTDYVKQKTFVKFESRLFTYLEGLLGYSAKEFDAKQDEELRLKESSAEGKGQQKKVGALELVKTRSKKFVEDNKKKLIALGVLAGAIFASTAYERIAKNWDNTTKFVTDSLKSIPLIGGFFKTEEEKDLEKETDLDREDQEYGKMLEEGRRAEAAAAVGSKLGGAAGRQRADLTAADLEDMEQGAAMRQAATREDQAKAVAAGAESGKKLAGRRTDTGKPTPVTPQAGGLEKFTMEKEGFSSKIYNDPAGFPTIGYGHMLRPKELESKKIILSDGTEIDISKGITEEQGKRIFQDDMMVNKEGALKQLEKLGVDTSVLSQPTLEALTDLAFNAGPGIFKKAPKLVAALKKNDIMEIAKELRTTGTIAGGMKLAGLQKRADERATMVAAGAAPSIQVASADLGTETNVSGTTAGSEAALAAKRRQAEAIRERRIFVSGTGNPDPSFNKANQKESAEYGFV